MSHFLSASCVGELCRACRRPAAHKISEEIPHDDPCCVCGCFWKFDGIPTEEVLAGASCRAVYHMCVGVPRHELAAYVCCTCFTELFGPVTGCPIGGV